MSVVYWNSNLPQNGKSVKERDFQKIKIGTTYILDFNEIVLLKK